MYIEKSKEQLCPERFLETTRRQTPIEPRVWIGAVNVHETRVPTLNRAPMACIASCYYSSQNVQDNVSSIHRLERFFFFLLIPLGSKKWSDFILKLYRRLFLNDEEAFQAIQRLNWRKRKEIDYFYRRSFLVFQVIINQKIFKCITLKLLCTHWCIQ